MVCTAAFGLAVVPDVCRQNSVCSASTGSAGQSPAGRSTASCHQWSRPSCIGTSAPVRRSTSMPLDGRRQRDGLVGDRLQRDRRALAPGLVLGDQRACAPVPSSRSPSEAGEKPPNTTTCGAPMPGAGQHRHRQLRHHPHVDADHVALADAQLAQRVGGAADLVAQLGVADRAVRLVRILRHEVVGDAVAASRPRRAGRGRSGRRSACRRRNQRAVRRVPLEADRRLAGTSPPAPRVRVQPEPVKVALGLRRTPTCR